MTMRDYTAIDLMELAGWRPEDHVHLGGSGEHTGVIIPRDYTAGEIMPSDHSRKLAAQLLRAADLYDAIWNAGYDKGQESVEPQINMLRRTLIFICAQIEGGEHTSQQLSKILEAAERGLGVFVGDDEKENTQPHIGEPGS